jgi:hypothetical protein
MTVIFGAPEAIAAGRCLTARSIDVNGVTTHHPRRCAWCAEPLDDLRRLVEGFNEWAGWKPIGAMGGVAARYDVQTFAELPRAEQLRQIAAAQAFEAESVQEAVAGGAADRTVEPVGHPVGAATEPPPPLQPSASTAPDVAPPSPLEEGPSWL